MPLYEYRCRTCDDTFELRRSVEDANAPATCPDGHSDAVRLLSVFAAAKVGAGSDPSPRPSAPCGSHCACH
jgi:putative FmdB family regulatory protein